MSYEMVLDNQAAQSPPTFQPSVPQPLPTLPEIGEYKHALGDCCKFPTNAYLSFCLPCLRFSLVVRRMQDPSAGVRTFIYSFLFVLSVFAVLSHFFFGLAVWSGLALIAGLYNSNIRSRLNIQGGTVGDICKFWWPGVHCASMAQLGATVDDRIYGKVQDYCGSSAAMPGVEPLIHDPQAQMWSRQRQVFDLGSQPIVLGQYPTAMMQAPAVPYVVPFSVSQSAGQTPAASSGGTSSAAATRTGGVADHGRAVPAPYFLSQAGNAVASATSSSGMAVSSGSSTVLQPSASGSIAGASFPPTAAPIPNPTQARPEQNAAPVAIPLHSSKGA
eukprot:Rmarinus@m.8406